MWVSVVDWDEPVGGDLSMKAMRWFNELLAPPSFHIPRCLRAKAAVKEVTLHTFGGCVPRGIWCGLLHKAPLQGWDCQLSSGIAPLQAVSIPRLELMAAVTGVKLSESISSALEIGRRVRVFWSDSMDALYWIRGQSRRFKPFVSNRVGEMQAFAIQSLHWCRRVALSVGTLSWALQTSLTYQSTITQLTLPHLRQTISFTANEEEGLHLTVLMLWLLIQGRDGAVFKNLFDTFFKGVYESGSQD